MKVNKHSFPLFGNKLKEENEKKYFTLIPPHSPHFIRPQDEVKREKEKIFNSYFLTSPPIIYPNEINIDHLSFLSFPSITFLPLFLPSPSLFNSNIV